MFLHLFARRRLRCKPKCDLVVNRCEGSVYAFVCFFTFPKVLLRPCVEELSGGWWRTLRVSGLPDDMRIPRHKRLGGDQYSRALSLQRRRGGDRAPDTKGEILWPKLTETEGLCRTSPERQILQHLPKGARSTHCSGPLSGSRFDGFGIQGPRIELAGSWSSATGACTRRFRRWTLLE